MLLDNLNAATTTNASTLARIYKHLYEQTQKSQPYKYKHFIYGAELAGRLNYISDEKKWELMATYESPLKDGPLGLATVLVP